MIETKYTTGRPNRRGFTAFTVIAVLFLLFLVFFMRQTEPKLLFQVGLFLSGGAAIWFFIRYAYTVYTFSIEVYEKPYFIVTGTVGKRVSTLARLPLDCLTDAVLLKVKTAVPKPTEYHHFCANYQPESVCRLTFSKKTDTKDTITVDIEAPEAFANALKGASEAVKHG